MIDIVEIVDELDMSVLDTQVGKAGNVLSIQIDTLDYAPTFGIDLRYFLQSDFQFQNESFRAYLLQRLAEHSVDVLSVTEVIESLYNQYAFGVSSGSGTGFVR